MRVKTRVKTSRIIGAAVLVAGIIGLSACAQSNGPVIAPVTMDVGDLQGATVQLVVDQVLNINTGDLAVDSYSGEVADTSIAEFVAGYEQDGTTYNPGVRALADGATTVVLSNSDGGIEDVTFTVEVGK